MKDLLRRLKLSDGFTTALSISKEEFVVRLKEVVDKDSRNPFVDFFRVFFLSKNRFKGTVTQDGFTIESNGRDFGWNTLFTTAKGTYQYSNGWLTIDTEINSYSNILLLPFFLYLAFYSFLIYLAWSSGAETSTVLLLSFVAVCILSIPYFIMRRSVSKLKHELEKEFKKFT